MQQKEKIVSIMDKLSQKIKGIQDNDEQYFNELAELDAAFHLEISAASGNDIAAEIINHIIPAFNQSNKAVLYLSRKAGLIEEEHLEILHAIQAGDSLQAETRHAQTYQPGAQGSCKSWNLVGKRALSKEEKTSIQPGSRLFLFNECQQKTRQPKQNKPGIGLTNSQLVLKTTIFSFM